MRHSDTKTTMAYYIDLLYQDIAANLHKRFTAQGAPVGDTFGDTLASLQMETAWQHRRRPSVDVKLGNECSPPITYRRLLRGKSARPMRAKSSVDGSGTGLPAPNDER